MVGIVGILLLGSLAWSAVGAMFSALGAATSSLSNSQPTPIRLPAVAATTVGKPQADVAGTPTLAPASEGQAAAALPTAGPTPAQVATPGATATPPPVATAARVATPAAGTPTPAAGGRAPWILLPQPAPGAHVAPGPLVVEARGRGDSPITALRLEIDGAGVGASFEQRSESTWRAAASTQVTPGRHTVRATVVDDQGRSGSFRWTFDAAP
jgi:hypothetical protein